MKALIFNSGQGSRLGELTDDRPKCMVRLGSGETILHRQIRILQSCGISEYVITTGPYADQLVREVRAFEDKGCTFSFVNNPVFDRTNYIYSMYLARDYLHGDSFLMLHGDLVFDAAFAQIVIDSRSSTLGSVNASLPLPEKDFKARVIDGEVREVSVGIFDDDCVAFQPFYKLSEAAMGIWLDEVGKFVEEGEVGVYAENAANCVFEHMAVMALSYEGHYVEEVDTPDDLARVSEEVRLFDFEQQPVFSVSGPNVELASGSTEGTLRVARDIPSVLGALDMRNPLIVTSTYFDSLGISKVLERAGIRFGIFSDYRPNPRFEDALRALDAFRGGKHDSLMSVGGGSAMDVAKCVKQLAVMQVGASGDDLRSKDLPFSGIVHVAMPTTAGTGSESTHFAVCYVSGEKVSVANDCLLPDAVLLDPANLAGLPDYQKKCTVLDALCQAIESHWSRRSTEGSRVYSAKAIPIIMKHSDGYLTGNWDAAAAIMTAANLAGKAINLTTTTAPHAMSYKLTSMYGIPHGHAVAMCMPGCWRILLNHGNDVTQQRLAEIAALMFGSDAKPALDGLDAFEGFCSNLGIANGISGKPSDIDILVASVNKQRLSNFAVILDDEEIASIYRNVVSSCGSCQ